MSIFGALAVVIHASLYSVTSNLTFEMNERTTTYVYLDDTDLEKLAKDLLDAIQQRKSMY